MSLYRTLLPDPFVPEVYVTARCVASAVPTNGTLVASANRAVYVPVWFPADCTLYALYFVGGNATGNYDLGFFDAAFAQLASTGATALATGRKSLTLPELRVSGGKVYWAALALSSISGQVYRAASGAAALTTVPVCEENSALPLPSTGTPVITTQTVIPWFAFGVR